MSNGFIAATKDFSLNFGMNVVIRRKQFLLVIAQPVKKAAAILMLEAQYRLFQLFHAHAGNFTVGYSFCEGKVLMSLSARS